jgi:hypothetical protein
LFFQQDATLVADIFRDLDAQLFGRASLIIEGIDDIMAFPGSALIGISVIANQIPPAFIAHEVRSQTVVTQISDESFHYRRLKGVPKIEGQRGDILSEIEFVSGERLYLEFSEVAATAIEERAFLNNQFARTAIACRRPDGGVSIWNTSHIVSWSHYPKLHVPTNAWDAELLDPPIGDSRPVATML